MMEIREPRPSDRVQMRDRADLQSPACCAICGNGTCREGYVDTSIFYQWEGQVYLCFNCGLEVARALGCLPPDQSEFLIKQNKEFAKELKELKDQYESASSRLAVYDSVVTAARFDAANRGIGEGNIEQSEDTANSPSDTDAGKPVAKEPVKGSRRTNAKRTTVRDGITL